MKAALRCDVAIVGGGFTGTTIAAHLARWAHDAVTLRLFDDGELGRGAAYGSSHREHLLNVRAEEMTAFPDEPDHFVRWLGSRGGARDFVSRRLYGDYLAEIAQRTFARRSFSLVPQRVRGSVLAGSGFLLETHEGTQCEAGAVVMAIGNALPGDAAVPAAIRVHAGYVADPWRFDFRRVGGHVLLVGSGLTALDVLGALDACNHRGAVDVVSRHARFPAVHGEYSKLDVVPQLDASGARTLLRSFRRHVADAQRRGFDSRAVVDAIRLESEPLWKRLPPAERARFERHLRGRWDRVRHRAPQSVDAVRERFAATGRMRVHKGRVAAARGSGVVIATAAGEELVVWPDWIVNCTGPARVGRRRTDCPVTGLLRDGLVTEEPLGMGLHADPSYRAIDANGDSVDGLYLAGPLLRGSRFEATAVPELRVVAQAVAAEMRRSLTAQRIPIRVS